MSQFETLLGFARHSETKTENETQRYLVGEQNSWLNPTYKRIVELRLLVTEGCFLGGVHSVQNPQRP